jgi:hypothetical protein
MSVCVCVYNRGSFPLMRNENRIVAWATTAALGRSFIISSARTLRQRCQDILQLWKVEIETSPVCCSKIALKIDRLMK